MDVRLIQDEITELRRQWRLVHNEKLDRKQELLNSNCTVSQIRHDHAYRVLRKKQKSLSIRIKHKEQKLNRILVRGKE